MTQPADAPWSVGPLFFDGCQLKSAMMIAAGPGPAIFWTIDFGAIAITLWLWFLTWWLAAFIQRNWRRRKAAPCSGPAS